MHIINRIYLVIVILVSGLVAVAQDVNLDVSLMGNASTGEFAPYYISSLKYGKVTQKNSLIADILASKDMDMSQRFSWGCGAELMGMTASTNEYDKWSQDEHKWYTKECGPGPLRVQQLYVEAKYRSLFAMIGQKNQVPMIVDPELSSGDVVLSGNARPIPEVRGGFHDYVNIPGTKGFLQVNIQVSYGIMTDDHFIEDRFNYYNYHIAKHTLFNYKHCLFRTNPDNRLSVKFGAQCGAFFGGRAKYYDRGRLYMENNYHNDLKALINIMVPIFDRKETFVEGSTLGSWDFNARYRLKGGQDVCAYFEWLFEDGSGIAKRNKWDGLWGLEFKTNNDGPLSKIVVEYVDFRDQAGPIHLAPSDLNNPTIQSHATGRDNYYNNAFYNSYANYGMAIGTPFMPSPIYNLSGYPAFACNRINGVHVGASGILAKRLKYRVLMGYQRGLGNYDLPFSEVKTNTSVLLEADYRPINHLRLNMQLAMDRGKLRGNNYGVYMSVSYNGRFEKKKNNSK